ncbi:hypothetical protein DQ936_18190 [Salmonella enterica subsp. enterica serovar Oslo]|nr:hypothetical protein [Salmonella enterica subsp. enterica serovar Oslo]
MYAVLGEIEFDVVAYWDEFESTMGVDYTSHARIEGKPGVQFIGDKLDKITLKFNFHSQYCQPTTELNRLREAMSAHQAMALVFGNGDYRGWFVITDLTATHQHTDPYGNVIAQGGTLSLQEYTGDPKSPLLPPAITTQEPNIDEMLDELPDVSDSWFDELLSAVEEGMREAKEMMDEVADAIDDIKKTIAQAKELVKEAKALKEKCADIVDSLKKTISAIDALFQQPLDLQTLAGLPKALAAKMQELIDSLPGIRECAGDAGTLIEHAESLFDAITSSVAQKHGLTLAGKIAPLTIDRVTQYAETDVAFLKRLASEYGYTVKVTATELIFSHLPTLRCLAPVKTLRRTDVSHYTFKDTINRIYKNATVQHQNSKQKELVIYTHDSQEKTSARGAATSADTLKINSRAPDTGAAQAKANAALDSHNEYQQTGTLTLMGCPQLTAGNKIELSDFGVLSGQWLIDKSMHKLTRSGGYTTEIDISRGPATSQ